ELDVHKGSHNILPTTRLPCQKLLKTRIPDTTRWHINNSTKTHTVTRLIQQSKIGNNIFYLFTIIETNTAYDLIRNSLLQERTLETKALRICAVKHGKITVVSRSH